MGGRRAVALAVLGITWASVCLVVPPLIIDALGPVVAPPVIGRHARSLVPPGPPLPAAAERTRPSPELDAPRRIDLYGNEVSNPVARYRVDDRGTLYEVHSPEIEVARLAPPRL